jgi:hypothetical protein
MMRRVVLVVLIALPAFAQLVNLQKPPNPAQTSSGTSSIEGTVVNDATNEPIRKAQVMLAGQPGAPSAVMTDASGSFAFHKLPAGRYSVSVTREGFDMSRASLLGDNQKPVTLTADQDMSGVELRLAPNGAISGRLTDENGDPAPHCSVSAVDANSIEGSSWQHGGGSATTDDRGEYRISDLPSGRYIVYQHCYRTLAAPHGFMERDDPRTPVWVWIPGLYGDPASGTGASTIVLHGGEEVTGIDFRLKTANAFSVSVAVVPDEPGLDLRNVWVRLEPQDRTMTRVREYSLGGKNGQWRAPGVLSGSYIAVAEYQQADKRWHGEVPVEVRDTPPDLVKLPLAAAATLSGDVQAEKSDDQENQPVRTAGGVALMPLDSWPGMMFLNAPVAADGSFTIIGVIPGRYELRLVGAVSSIQSVTLGGQQVSPHEIHVGGAGGPLHVTVSLKHVGLQVSVDDLRPDRQTWVFVLPKGTTSPGLNPPMAPATQSPATLQVAPGEYVAYAVECEQPWQLFNDPAGLRAIASLGKAVEVKGDGDASVTVGVIGHDELKRALDQELQ